MLQVFRGMLRDVLIISSRKQSASCQLPHWLTMGYKLVNDSETFVDVRGKTRKLPMRRRHELPARPTLYGHCRLGIALPENNELPRQQMFVCWVPTPELLKSWHYICRTCIIIDWGTCAWQVCRELGVWWERRVDSTEKVTMSEIWD